MVDFKEKNQNDLQRRLAMGITRARWLYNDAGRAPCNHRSLDEKAFDLRKGMLFEGRRIQPGDEPNCRCMSAAIIPGFDDEPGEGGIISWLKRMFIRS